MQVTRKIPALDSDPVQAALEHIGQHNDAAIVVRSWQQTQHIARRLIREGARQRPGNPYEFRLFGQKLSLVFAHQVSQDGNLRDRPAVKAFDNV